jgi:hypothetical protein
MTLPHMHEWGKSFTATITHDGVPSTMIDKLTWDPGYTFHPPEHMFDVSTPFLFHSGDKVDVHCEWFNDTNADLFFQPCVLFPRAIDDRSETVATKARGALPA